MGAQVFNGLPEILPLFGASRKSDPKTSKAAGASIRPSSQAGKLLEAFSDRLPLVHSGRLSDLAMNATEAKDAAGLSDVSCYWKRVSELKQAGLIRPMDGVLRPCRRSGKLRESYIITDEGRRALNV